jgi:tetratricopeptide (TPR) repeat protein
MPNPNDWFAPPLPSGTTFDVYWRFPGLRSQEQVDLGPLELLRSIAPFNYNLQNFYVNRKYGKAPSATELRAAYGVLTDYNLRAMREISYALRDQPDEYQKAVQGICTLQPREYLYLGYYLAERKLDDQAAAAFEKGVSLTLDDVVVANNSWWLVNYYFDHGQTNEALQLAERAADVYSHRGLATMGDLMERMGDLAQAEDYFKKIQERYNYKDELIGFYARANRNLSQKMYEVSLEKLSADIFPNGIDFVTLADFEEAPHDGVLINSSSSYLQKTNLKVGDVIVALDGYRIRTDRQYSCARSMTQNPNMDFIVWRKGEYAEIKAFVKDRYLDVSMSNYRPK